MNPHDDTTSWIERMTFVQLASPFPVESFDIYNHSLYAFSSHGIERVKLPEEG